jgi:hypothetical protein
MHDLEQEVTGLHSPSTCKNGGDVKMMDTDFHYLFETHNGWSGDRQYVYSAKDKAIAT